MILESMVVDFLQQQVLHTRILIENSTTQAGWRHFRLAASALALHTTRSSCGRCAHARSARARKCWWRRASRAGRRLSTRSCAISLITASPCATWRTLIHWCVGRLEKEGMEREQKVGGSRGVPPLRLLCPVLIHALSAFPSPPPSKQTKKIN